ncbi:MAG: hypothetical protein Kow00129_17460 [Thermoleophilia bacterium]
MEFEVNSRYPWVGRLVRRALAATALLGVLAVSVVAWAAFQWPFLGFWYLVPPTVAAVAAAVVLRMQESSRRVWTAAAGFFLPALFVWALVFTTLLSRAGG